MPRSASVSESRAADSAGFAVPAELVPVEPLRVQCLAEFKRGFVPPEDIVADMLRRGWLYALTGPTGHAKTAIAALLSLCVAAGRDFAGRMCEPGRVLYLAGENPDDVRARFIVQGEQSQFDDSVVGDRVHVIDARFTLNHRLTELVEILDSSFDDPFTLLIVDTDAAYAGSDDENDNAERVRHALNLRRLTRSKSRPTVVDLCHPTKNASNENLLPRGGGAFIAEIDGNFGIWRDGDTAQVFVAGKHRGPPFAPLKFRIREGASDCLRDRRGRQMRVPYVEALDDAGAAEQEQGEVEKRLALLRAIRRLPGASLAVLATECGWRFQNGEPDKSKVQRAIAQLKSADAIERDEVSGQWKLLPNGESVLRGL